MTNFLKKLQSLSLKKPKHEKPSIQGPETIVVLKFNAHCPNCCKDVGKCIEKAKGVVSVDVDLENEEATVKGRFHVENLKAHIFKKLTKRVEILSQTFPIDDEEREESSNTVEASNNKDDEEKKRVQYHQ